MIKTFVWKNFIHYILITNIFECLFIIFGVFIISGFSPAKMLQNAIVFLILDVMYLLTAIIHYRNAFAVVKMDKYGIRNKYISIEWENTMNYRIVTAGIGRPPFRASADIICFGNTDCGYFTKLNPRKTVFVSLTPEVERYIRENTQNYISIDL